MHKVTVAGAILAVLAASGAAPATARVQPLPGSVERIMAKPRYANATWSLLVSDVRTGAIRYALRPDRMAFTGSTRKLFSVGVALNALGADHREVTSVFGLGSVAGDGTLQGDLVLRAGGDLTFGGRRVNANTVAVSHFDHNDANNLGTATLTPQDPLFAMNDLARQVRASGITAISGDVAIDDRLFDPYRVPNGNLLITPMMLNENMVDVSVTPTEAGQPATVTSRPETAALTVDGAVTTSAAGTEADVDLSGGARVDCLGRPGCTATISGSVPADYRAPFIGTPDLVRTFRVEEPAAFARTAFVEALARAGVTVTAPVVAPNPRGSLPAPSQDPPGPRLAAYRSAPYAEVAKLVLKVSLNLGANLSVSLFGLEHGHRTIQGALAAERRTLIRRYGLKPGQFDFPTNGSGTPDSRATPRAIVRFLRAMQRTPVARQFATALPVLGVDGSLATSGRDLPARGRVRAKTGTTISPGADGETLELKAQNFAGYIRTRSGRLVAYALMVNDAGAIDDVEQDVGAVIADEAAISNAIYEAL